MEEKDEIIISLSDVWNIIKKNAAFIIIVTLICAIGSFFITRYFIPKLYTSSIQLYVDTSNDDENKNNLNILSEQTYAQNLVATYIKMLNTNTFYTELSEHINNKYTAKQLSEMVSFSSDEKTEIFDAKVVCSNTQAFMLWACSYQGEKQRSRTEIQELEWLRQLCLS